MNNNKYILNNLSKLYNHNGGEGNAQPQSETTESKPQSKIDIIKQTANINNCNIIKKSYTNKNIVNNIRQRNIIHECNTNKQILNNLIKSKRNRNKYLENKIDRIKTENTQIKDAQQKQITTDADTSESDSQLIAQINEKKNNIRDKYLNFEEYMDKFKKLIKDYNILKKKSKYIIPSLKFLNSMYQKFNLTDIQSLLKEINDINYKLMIFIKTHNILINYITQNSMLNKIKLLLYKRNICVDDKNIPQEYNAQSPYKQNQSNQNQIGGGICDDDIANLNSQLNEENENELALLQQLLLFKNEREQLKKINAKYLEIVKLDKINNFMDKQNVEIQQKIESLTKHNEELTSFINNYKNKFDEIKHKINVNSDYNKFSSELMKIADYNIETIDLKRSNGLTL
jgi:hypothetical protein